MTVMIEMNKYCMCCCMMLNPGHYDTATVHSSYLCCTDVE